MKSNVASVGLTLLTLFALPVQARPKPSLPIACTGPSYYVLDTVGTFAKPFKCTQTCGVDKEVFERESAKHLSAQKDPHIRGLDQLDNCIWEKRSTNITGASLVVCERTIEHLGSQFHASLDFHSMLDCEAEIKVLEKEKDKLNAFYKIIGSPSQRK